MFRLLAAHTPFFCPRAETAGRYCLIDMLVPDGGGPPPHRHDFEEMFTLLQGELAFTFGKRKPSAPDRPSISQPTLRMRSRIYRARQPACSVSARRRDRRNCSWPSASPSTAAPRRRRKSAPKHRPRRPSSWRFWLLIIPDRNLSSVTLRRARPSPRWHHPKRTAAWAPAARHQVRNPLKSPDFNERIKEYPRQSGLAGPIRTL